MKNTRRIRTLAIALAGIAALAITACNPSGGSIERKTMEDHAGLAAASIGFGLYNNLDGKLVSYTCDKDTEQVLSGHRLSCTVKGTITIDGKQQSYSGLACIYSVYTGDKAVAKLRTSQTANTGGNYAKVDGVWKLQSSADYSLMPGETAGPGKSVCLAPAK